ALVVGQRVYVDHEIAGLDGGGVVDDLLALFVVHRDREPHLRLVDDLDQGRGRRAGLEPDRLGLFLGERLLRVRHQLELIPGRERRLLELLLDALELAVDRRLVARLGRDLEELAARGDLAARVVGPRRRGSRTRGCDDQRTSGDGEPATAGHMPSTVSSGVTQITVAWPSSSSRLITVLDPPGVSSESISGVARSATSRTRIAPPPRVRTPMSGALGRSTSASAATAPALTAPVMTCPR